MTSSYPYIISNNKIGPILEKIRVAAKPPKVSQAFLKHLGFGSSNDRAIIPVLRSLGFISESGAPTMYYDQLRDNTLHKRVLAERIKDLYKDLFLIDTNINKAKDDEIKGAISRVTGKDEKSVNRYFSTFKALTNLADFSRMDSHVNTVQEKTENNPTQEKKSDSPAHANPPLFTNGQNSSNTPQFHYNIQIHLPATTDISVYNVIFKSVRENLINE